MPLQQEFPNLQNWRRLYEQRFAPTIYNSMFSDPVTFQNNQVEFIQNLLDSCNAHYLKVIELNLNYINDNLSVLSDKLKANDGSATKPITRTAI